MLPKSTLCAFLHILSAWHNFASRFLWSHSLWTRLPLFSFPSSRICWTSRRAGWWSWRSPARYFNDQDTRAVLKGPTPNMRGIVNIIQSIISFLMLKFKVLLKIKRSNDKNVWLLLGVVNILRENIPRWRLRGNKHGQHIYFFKWCFLLTSWERSKRFRP